MAVNKTIKKILIDQDLTLGKLAEATGYSRVHLSSVINGHFVGKRVRIAIANALNKNFNDLWGDQDNASA